MNGNRRFYLLGALLCGLFLLAILLPSATGEAQSTDWTPARIDFGDSGLIRLVDLDTDTGVPARTGQAASSTTQSIQSASQMGGEWITIFSDDFEGAFPGEWHVSDRDGATHGEYFWGKRDCSPYSGSYSAWAVGGGAAGSALPCDSHYPDNADSVMVYGPFSLEDATEAELRFMYWLNSEPENDHLWVGASTGGLFYGARTSGTRDWALHTFDLTDVFTLGDLTGEDQVWITIAFTSNESTTLPEGAYIDDVVLRKYVEGPTVYLPLAVRNFPVTPEAPVLDAISNPDGDGNYTVSWSSSVGASTYTLQEATNADFSDATTAYSGSNTSAGISGRDVGTYYYRVRASNPYASSDWSNVQSVDVTIPLPECPRTGEWFGTTDQGHRISFVVEDSPRCQIAENSLTIGIGYGWYDVRTVKFFGSFAITNNQFSTGCTTDVTYVEGEFTSYTTATGIFEYSGGDYTASGTWASPTEAADDFVYALALQADEKIVVGGVFTRLRGEWRYGIARLNPDGTLDEAFNPGADASVRVLALQPDGKILVGGAFTKLGGQPRAGIARLNPDGTLDTSFNPGANDRVSALAVQPDGKIVVGGAFTTLGGEPQYRIGRLNPDGSVDAGFNPGASDSVQALALQADGKIVVGGNFTELGGEPRFIIGRLNADGSLDGAFDPGEGSWGGVYALTVQSDGKILVGGSFMDMGGQRRDNIARLNPDGTADAAFNPGASGSVHALAVQADAKILVGSSISPNIERLNADGTRDAGFSQWANGVVQAVAVQADEKIVLGGWFTRLSGTARPYLGRLNADGTLDTSFP